MINLSQVETTSFKIENAILPRTFDATLSRFNDVILRDIKTSYRINLGDLANIRLDGQPTTLEEIKQSVYNYSCENCETPTIPPNFKIFDITFDITFE